MFKPTKSNTSLHKNFILTVTDNDDKILARITSPYYTRDMLNRHFPCFDDENKTSGLAICFNFTIDHDESEVENRIKVEEKHNRFRGWIYLTCLQSIVRKRQYH